MGMKYCPKCKEVVVTKVLGNYSQVVYQGVPAKRRKIGHLEQDGGCGHNWYSCEVTEELLNLGED